MLLLLFNLLFNRGVVSGPKYFRAPAKQRNFIAPAKPRNFVAKQGNGQMITAPSKLAVEEWNIGIDFSPQLAPEEAITGASVVPVGSISATLIEFSGTVVSFVVNGGTKGDRCTVQISVSTSNGEVLAEYWQTLII